MIALALGAHPTPASAQAINLLPTDDTAGLATEPGVTVQSRRRPDYDPPGIRIGSFVVRPRLDESFGYGSNVLGGTPAKGSPVLTTAPALSVASDWSRGSLNAGLSLADTRYLDQPAQSRTDWTASVGGGVALGRDELTLAFDHLSLHQDGTALGAFPTEQPVPYQVEDLRARYAFRWGRFTVEPALDGRLYRFGDATIAGQSVSQGFRDRYQLQGSLTARYEVSDTGSLLALLRTTGLDYTSTPSGAPSQNAVAYEALAGLDSGARGPWRYRLLAGVGVRDYASQAYRRQVAPVAEADVAWTPNGMTTVTAILARTVRDPTVEGTSASTYTSAGLAIDHEYLRNLILRAHAGFQRGQFNAPAATDDLLSAGAGATWLLNRHLRLSLTYDYTDKRSTLPDSGYTRSIGLLKLRLAL